MLPLYPGNENICRRMYLSGLINLTENFRFAYGQVLSYSVLSNELLRRNISSSQNTVLLLSSLFLRFDHRMYERSSWIGTGNINFGYFYEFC